MDTRNKSVLVVDDTPVNIQLLTELLKPKYKIKAATSGAKALLIAQKIPAPDLILLDVMMPEMDGYEVCRQLKENLATAQIPVVFVTGHASAEERQRGLELGALDFLSKPVNPDTLLSLVAQIL